MNTSFTPGPWIIRYERYNRHVLCSPCHPGGLGHFTGWSEDGVTTVDQDEANARLIAQSPELLACLKALVEIFDPNEQCIYGFARPQIEAARAAINLATGQEP